jgi:transcriptional regulator with XRE-family HTH domain
VGTSFGDRVRELRKERGWTQRQLADRVDVRDEQGARRGIDFTYLSKIENDKEQASEKVILALAKTLGADADELLLLAQKIPTAQREEITATEGGRTFLRSVRGLSEGDWQELIDTVKRQRKKK